MPLVALNLSGLIFAHFGIWSIHLGFAFFPSLADAHVIADKVQLFAMPTEPCALVISGHRNALNPDLGHEAVVVIPTV